MSKQHSKFAMWWYERRGRLLPVATVSVLLLVIAVIAGAFYKGAKKPPAAKPELPQPVLSTSVVSVTNDARASKAENGRTRYLLTAAKDTTYSDGRHELEKVVLVSYLPNGPEGKEESKLEAERGVYYQQAGQVECTGNVKLVNSDGAEITTQLLRYDQNTEVATTDQPVQFKRGEVSGTSVGAIYYVKTKVADLVKDAHLIRQHPVKDKPGPPTELTAQHLIYDALKGEAFAQGNATITQGGQTAKADSIKGFLDVKTQQLKNAELRGNAYLKEVTPQKTSEIQSRDMDFFFDERQELKQAVAVGGAQGRSLEKDAPRELKAERIEANYVPTKDGSVLQTLNTQGRTTLKIIAADETQKPDPKAPAIVVRSSERVLESDTVSSVFQPDGKYLARVEANGKAVMTITPLQVTPKAERKILHATKFNAEFMATKNLLKTAIAEGDAVADFELMMPPPKPTKPNEKPKSGKRSLKANKLTANLHPETQDVLDMVADGEMKYTDNDRNSTAERGTYDAVAQMVALRGKPVLWDDNARTNADEIDANLDTGESYARGKVRTTYYSRDTTGGAAPFKKSKAPVTIASDTATVRHREAAARYQGNARAWQEDDFVRGDNLELDKGESTMHAWGNVQSAFYSVEREVEMPKTDAGKEATKPDATPKPEVTKDASKPELKKKEVVPVFVSADDLVYDDKVRTAHYAGKVKIRQASDQIDAAKADAVMDENKKLSQLTAAQNVILTQPQRRGTGDLLVYTAATDAAVLTGKPAFLEDRERETTSKSPQLTLFLRDARMQAVDETGKKRVRTTHRIAPKTN
ncbi:MAG: LPS export ABC transporter periplasmic protein LptC [Acidobacteria bacterium]|nr:LPS export ABC transporter periplasmic protein LptC [Acidobacteriota bacterium]